MAATMLGKFNLKLIMHTTLIGIYTNQVKVNWRREKISGQKLMNISKLLKHILIGVKHKFYVPYQKFQFIHLIKVLESTRKH